MDTTEKDTENRGGQHSVPPTKPSGLPAGETGSESLDRERSEWLESIRPKVDPEGHTTRLKNMLAFFGFRHLPPHQQELVSPFEMLAHDVARRCPRSPETVVVLRKLIEARDAAIRADIQRMDL